MLTKTEKLFSYLKTDNKEQKELVKLFNDWYKDTALLSSVPTSNKYWDIMANYCMHHKKLVKNFWIEMYNQFGEVGHFTFMLFRLFPDMIEIKGGYCPLTEIEKAWVIYFNAEK